MDKYKCHLHPNPTIHNLALGCGAQGPSSRVLKFQSHPTDNLTQLMLAGIPNSPPPMACQPPLMSYCIHAEGLGGGADCVQACLPLFVSFGLGGGVGDPHLQALLPAAFPPTQTSSAPHRPDTLSFVLVVSEDYTGLTHAASFFGRSQRSLRGLRRVLDPCPRKEPAPGLFLSLGDQATSSAVLFNRCFLGGGGRATLALGKKIP